MAALEADMGEVLAVVSRRAQRGDGRGAWEALSPIVSIQSSTKCTLKDPCLNASGVQDEPCTVPPYVPTPWAFWLRAAFGCTIQDVRPISNNSGDPYRFYAVIAPSTTDQCHLDLSQFTNEGNNYPPDAYMVGMVDG